MSTISFNIIDVIISKLRISEVECYLKANDEVLDIGCGYQAYLLKHVKDKIKAGIGIDREINNSGEGKIKLFKYNFDRILPFKSKSFNKVLLLAVIEHFKENKAAYLIKEIYRILKPSGEMIITTPTPQSKPIAEFLAYKLHIISSNEIADHKKYYSIDDLNKISQKYNFRLVKYKSFEFGLNGLYIYSK